MLRQATNLDLADIDGVMPATQARSRAAQERLVRAGERVFAKMGYDAAHVSDIVSVAGCSIGSFYRRFRDKEALFRALQARFAQRAMENVDRFFALPRCQTDPVEVVVLTYVENTARAIRKNPGVFRALFQRSLAGAGDIYFPMMRLTDEHAGRRLAEFLEARGAASRDDLVRRCVLALRTIEAALVHRAVHGDGDSLEDPELAQLLTRMLLAIVL